MLSLIAWRFSSPLPLAIASHVLFSFGVFDERQRTVSDSEDAPLLRMPFGR